MDRLKFTIRLLTAAIVVSSLAVSVFAAPGWVDSEYKDVDTSWGQYRIQSQAYVPSDAKGLFYDILIKNANPKQEAAPTGYLGCQARLYTLDRALAYCTRWTYNNSPSKGWDAGNDVGIFRPDVYYSMGAADFWNGRGYDTYISYQTPYYDYVGPNASAVEYEVNPNGQTYGSDFCAASVEEAPDLIAVIGINGVSGYVYGQELNQKPATPEEAVAMTLADQGSYTIPVYDVDGETILDYFQIG